MRPVQAPQQSFLGIAVDVEYLPLDDAATAAPLLQVRMAERVVVLHSSGCLERSRWAHSALLCLCTWLVLNPATP